MGTKGPSNHYGNSKGGRQSKFNKFISYKYAVAFNKNIIKQHFDDHGIEMNCYTKDEYIAHAIKFANCVDREKFTSFIDNNDTTYKYDKKHNILALIDKKGYVITYFKPREGRKYYNNQLKKKGKSKNEKHKKIKQKV